jgi:hypothetical protein
MGSLTDGWEIFKDLVRGGWRHWSKPSLTITYEPRSEPFVGLAADRSNRRTAFYRLDVTNDGRSPAEDCRGYLLNVEPVGSQPMHRGIGKPLQLKWAHETDYQPIRIGAKEQPPRKLDLFFVFADQRNELHFFVDQPQIPVGIATDFPAREYRVSVKVEMKDNKPATAKFVVNALATFDGATIAPVA